MPDLFQQLVINESISLANVPKVLSAQASRAFHPDVTPDGGIRLRGRASYVSTRSAEQEFELGPFECKVEEGVEITASLFTLQNFSFDVTPNLSLDFQYDASLGGLQRLVLTGGLDGSLTADPRLTGAFNGSVECSKALGVLILPFGGPVGAVLSPAVPLGVSFKAGGELNLGGFGFDLFVQAHADASVGVDCTAGCNPVLNLTSNADGSFKPALPTPFDSAFRAQLAVSGAGFAKLALVNPFLKALQVSALEFDAFKFQGGLTQSVDLASQTAQVADPTYASGFQLTPFLKAGTGSSVELLAKLLKITLLSASFEPSFSPLATSPKGTFTVTPPSVRAGDSTQLGDQATFTVTLDPVTYLGLDAVDGVEIRRKVPDGNGGFTLELSRPGCTDLAATSGQKVFTCQTDFLAADTGQQVFYAFVKARLFGIPMPVSFEIAPDAQAMLQVTDSSPGSVAFFGIQSLVGVSVFDFPDSPNNCLIERDGTSLSDAATCANVIGTANSSGSGTVSSSAISLSADGTITGRSSVAEFGLAVGFQLTAPMRYTLTGSLAGTCPAAGGSGAQAVLVGATTIDTVLIRPCLNGAGTSDTVQVDRTGTLAASFYVFSTKIGVNGDGGGTASYQLTLTLSRQ